MAVGRSRLCALAIAMVASLALPAAASTQASQAQRIQTALETWLAERTQPERITGVAAYVSFGDPGPAIEAFAGTVATGPDAKRVDQDTLFQMGSTSKSFAVAIILKLEAAGRLSIDDTIGQWLPQYPAWKDVSIRRLLNMTSGIKNYSETETMSRIWASEPKRVLTAADLVKIVYPSGTDDPPPTPGYHYSNTNYVLAGMIASTITGRSYRDLVHDMVIDPFGLNSTFYESGPYPASVARRLAHGYFDNPACADDQPNCERSWNLPLLGRDVHDMSTSWAQAAGGAIASARDVDRWMRVVFEGHVVPPKQQDEWLALVSMKGGMPISDVSPEHPFGFSLGLGKGVLGPIGAQWFYQGETLGYRTLYVWFAKDRLMITLQTNSQPAAEADQLKSLLATIYRIAQDGMPSGKAGLPSCRRAGRARAASDQMESPRDAICLMKLL